MTSCESLRAVFARIFNADPESAKQSDYDRRVEWALALGVTTRDIQSWLNGELPEADKLVGIQAVLLQDATLSLALKEEFQRLMNLPLEEILKHPGPDMGPTLKHYMLRPLRQEALLLLDLIPAKDQEEVLTQLGEEVRARKFCHAVRGFSHG